jgi:conjugative transposon TraM protein
MEHKTLSLKEQKRRKMLLVLPLLTLPFITLLFWTLGGGKIKASSTELEEKIGFNIELPEPRFKADVELNKLSYYNQATSDSIKRQEQIRKDPNYLKENHLKDRESTSDGDTIMSGKSTIKARSGLITNSFKDPKEEKIYQKLRALEKVINQPQDPYLKDQDMSEFESRGPSSMKSDDIRSLEQMMSAMNQPQLPDPQLKQLGGMLENILDIQHPARVEEKLKQASISQKDKVFAVTRKSKEANISSFENTLVMHIDNKNTAFKQNSFYSISEDSLSDETQNALEAVIHETQTVVDGATIKLRLSTDIYIQGVLIPKNSFLFGIASLKGERLDVSISTIKYKNSLFPVELSLYDLDGISGIYIPGAINRDVAKSSADRSIQTLGVASLNDSWGAQAAGVGIEAAKSLMSKKVKLIKVLVKAGYQVLLYDEKQKNSN